MVSTTGGDLSFVCDRVFGLFAMPSPRALVRSRGPVGGSVHLVIVIPHVFICYNEGAEPSHAFLAERSMVLGELLTGLFEWSPGIPFAGAQFVVSW